MSNNTNNPYSTPTSDVDNKAFTKSSLPKIIGIVSIVLGALGLFGALAGLASMIFMPQVLEVQMNMGLSKNYLIGSNAVSALGSAWAIFIGIKLVKYLDAGRRHYNFYAIYTVIMSIVGYVVTQGMLKKMFGGMTPEMGTAAMETSAITSLTLFVAPIIVIIVAIMLNQQKVKDSLN